MNNLVESYQKVKRFNTDPSLPKLNLGFVKSGMANLEIIYVIDYYKWLVPRLLNDFYDTKSLNFYTHIN